MQPSSFLPTIPNPSVFPKATRHLFPKNSSGQSHLVRGDHPSCLPWEWYVFEEAFCPSKPSRRGSESQKSLSPTNVNGALPLYGPLSERHSNGEIIRWVCWCQPAGTMAVSAHLQQGLRNSCGRDGDIGYRYLTSSNVSCIDLGCFFHLSVRERAQRSMVTGLLCVLKCRWSAFFVVSLFSKQVAAAVAAGGGVPNIKAPIHGENWLCEMLAAELILQVELGMRGRGLATPFSILISFFLL